MASSQCRADEAPNAASQLGDSDTRALKRVYSLALHKVGERIVINDEIERRLAIVVLFTFGAEAADASHGHDATVALCVERLMAQTAPSACASEAI